MSQVSWSSTVTQNINVNFHLQIYLITILETTAHVAQRGLWASLLMLQGPILEALSSAYFRPAITTHVVNVVQDECVG